MLADDAYWFTQHDVTGGLRTSERAAGLMVAAAMLGELAIQDTIRVERHQVIALLPAVLPVDALGAAVVDQIMREQARYSAANWIEFLAGDIRDRVALRLITAGEAEQHRSGFRRRRIAVSKRGDTRPAWVHAGLVRVAERGEIFAYEHQFLLGLALHSTINDHPLERLDGDRLAYVRERVAQIDDRLAVVLEVAVEAIRGVAVVR